jgi:hypothetical protein
VVPVVCGQRALLTATKRQCARETAQWAVRELKGELFVELMEYCRS